MPSARPRVITTPPACRIAIPSRVKVRGRWWVVLVVDPRDGEDGPSLERYGAIGLTLPERREIRLSSKLRGRALEVVFLHELVHACAPTVRNSRAEERLCTKVAPNLADVLAQLRWRRAR